ncbi:MAG: hypothetical protein KAG19_03615 [Methylococcales bacterium]|nr:hypothetical protein [Methylococcales bacterium]
MSKKKKAAQKVNIGSPESQASSLFDAGKYKEAIPLYKKIVQSSDSEAHREQLIQCYLKRAAAFAAKSMYKEAVALWENHQEYTQAPFNDFDQYILWLILSKGSQQAKAKTHLNQLSAEQLNKTYPKLAVALGALLLSTHPELQSELPQDSALIADFKSVQEALQALQNSDKTLLDASLKKIPFRSAFKDLRIILNAVNIAPESIEKAQSLFAKIPENSAYFQTAQLLILSTLEGKAFADNAIALNKDQRNTVGTIKGLEKPQLKFLEQLCQKTGSLTDKVKFTLAIQYKSQLGEDLASAFCQATLAHYPAGKKIFNKHFDTFNDADSFRIRAIKEEQRKDFYESHSCWEEYITFLHDNDSKSSDHPLKIALILRRMALQSHNEEDEANDFLERSIRHDPCDKESYLKIIAYYSRHPERGKDYKLWLTKTLDQFPQDIDVLVKITNAALKNKTYKKACQYAKKILKIDPINTFAKQTLFSSHLAHARRLMHEKNYRLVEKEISTAEKLNISKKHQQYIQLMQGFLCFSEKNKKQGLQSITEALSALHTDPVNIHFQAGIEALLNNAPLSTILRALPSPAKHLLSATELTKLATQLEQYVKDDVEQASLHKMLEKVKAPLKKSLPSQDYDETLLLSFCKILSSIEHFELLRVYAKYAQAKWQKPIWMYYRIYAENNGTAQKISDLDFDRMDNAAREASTARDHQTTTLINTFMESLPDEDLSSGVDDFFSQLFGSSHQDEEDAYEVLFQHIPNDIMMKLDKKAESIAENPKTRDKLIRKVVGAIEKAGGGEMSIMKVGTTPDIQSSFFMLEAAKQLNIDIDIDLDDIFDAFDLLEDSSSPFNFPF